MTMSGPEPDPPWSSTERVTLDGVHPRRAATALLATQLVQHGAKHCSAAPVGRYRRERNVNRVTPALADDQERPALKSGQSGREHRRRGGQDGWRPRIWHCADLPHFGGMFTVCPQSSSQARHEPKRTSGG